MNITQVYLLEGSHGWDVRFPVTRRGEYYFERDRGDRPITNDMITVFEFPTFKDAYMWLIYETKFKISHFPQPDGSQVFAAPISFKPSFGM